jgi:RsbT co-antagonist protein rsbRD N-terminal domain
MDRVNIAYLIETHRDELVDNWVLAVRGDQAIQSDSDLSEGGLIDHVPVLLDEVSALLRAGQTPTVHNMPEARVHAYTRYRQGYRARDLVREIALLRLLLIEHINSKLNAESAHLPLQDYFTAIQALNLYLDEELRYGVAIYTEERAMSLEPARV